MVNIVLRILFTMFIWCPNILVAYGQRTYYYKLLKIVRINESSTNVSGGQFITFNNNVCYESDKKGYQVNNSRLNYQATENNIIIYRGTSYWGEGTTFLFTTDNARLNVKTGNEVYIYERSTAPSGVETCSLIRKQPIDKAITSTPVVPIQSSTPVTDNAHNQSVPTSQSPIYTICTNCKGKKTVKKHVYIHDFKEKWCNECDDVMKVCHVHLMCPTCNGTGKERY